MKIRNNQNNYFHQIAAILIGIMLSFLFTQKTAFANEQIFLESIGHKLVEGKAELQLFFNRNVNRPQAFVLHNPDRMIFDFENVMLNTRPTKSINQGGIQKVILKESGNKLRLMVFVDKFNGYTITVKGNSISIKVSPKQAAQNKPPVTEPKSVAIPPTIATPAPIKTATPAATEKAPVWDKLPPAPKKVEATTPIKPAPIQVPKPPIKPAPVAHVAPIIQKSSPAQTLRAIDFRRDSNGNAKVILDLPSANTNVNVTQTGSTIYLLMKDVDTPSHLQKRLDVLDFATPVNYIDTKQKDKGSKITIFTNGNIKHEIKREGSRLILHVIKKKPKPRKKNKKVFTGDKLSLNFQDIEVRSVLQLLADFTNKNIVVSDTVDGSITLRLKDVPWDQALDIVLETKNLAMRENGNVIWIAPASELAAKEQQELEAQRRRDDLEELITEYISINFAKAIDLALLIQKSQGTKTHSLLSSRGSVSLDERTNTLLIQDTDKRVQEIRKLIEALDVPVQQVLIESRVVVASDEFSKDLGSRFGVTPVIGNNNGIITTSGSATATDTMVNSAIENLGSNGTPYPVTAPALADRLNVNLPVVGAAGAIGFSILAKDFLLDLELSALQAESKGEVIATPRVITSNQNQATIEQGVEIPYQQASSSGATNVSFKKAVLSMDVTPQITPDEHIVLDLKVHQDTVGEIYSDIPSINTRQIQTKVLVENGQTIVLGGVHEETNLNSVEKVPVLGDLPVVGNIFRKTHTEDSKRELLIFVTPKIVDEF